jgi:negative regulator of replication initiation
MGSSLNPTFINSAAKSIGISGIFCRLISISKTLAAEKYTSGADSMISIATAVSLVDFCTHQIKTWVSKMTELLKD